MKPPIGYRDGLPDPLQAKQSTRTDPPLDVIEAVAPEPEPRPQHANPALLRERFNVRNRFGIVRRPQPVPVLHGFELEPVEQEPLPSLQRHPNESAAVAAVGLALTNER